MVRTRVTDLVCSSSGSVLAELLITMSDEIFFPLFTMTQRITNTPIGYITIHFTHYIHDVLNIHPKSTITVVSD